MLPCLSQLYVWHLSKLDGIFCRPCWMTWRAGPTHYSYSSCASTGGRAAGCSVVASRPCSWTRHLANCRGRHRKRFCHGRTALQTLYWNGCQRTARLITTLMHQALSYSLESPSHLSSTSSSKTLLSMGAHFLIYPRIDQSVYL